MGRFLPPLKKRSHLMCDYTGEYDSTRTSHEEWEEKDYATIVALITKAPFSSLDEPLQPFDKVDRPLPEVKLLPLLVLEFRNRMFTDYTPLSSTGTILPERGAPPSPTRRRGAR